MGFLYRLAPDRVSRVVGQLTNGTVTIDPRDIRKLASGDRPRVTTISREWRLTSQERQPYAGGSPITPAKSEQLPSSLTGGGNLKQSIEEQSIAVGIDRQAVYNPRTYNSYTPDTGTFYLPTTGSTDLSDMQHSTWFVYATHGATSAEVINVYLQASLDGGSTFHRLAGHKISDADFVRGEWNSIDVGLRLAECKLEIVCENEAPGSLEAAVIRGA